MPKTQARIISLVPSWTETLLNCGVQVVGRTRFCIHPQNAAGAIPAVGGTKNLKLEEILNLKPDYVLLDKEENKKEMAEALEEQGIKLLVSHVKSIRSAAAFLKELSGTLENDELQNLALEYERIFDDSLYLSRELFFENAVKPFHLPASEELRNQFLNEQSFQYVIWKDPFMLIGPGTFIHDVFSLFGLKLIGNGSEPYPQIQTLELQNYFCLFSTEPYPFARDFKSLQKEFTRSALVDGEKISWYGIRNLKFLKSCLTKPS